jgi:sulfur carrier protein ThiS
LGFKRVIFKDMEVKVKIIGVPKVLPGFERQKEPPVNFSGDSVRDLIHLLSSEMDSETGSPFISDQGEISTDLAVIANGIMISDSNRANFRLREGDLVELVSAPG